MPSRSRRSGAGDRRDRRTAQLARDARAVADRGNVEHQHRRAVVELGAADEQPALHDPGRERLDDQLVVVEYPVDGERVEVAPAEPQDDEQRGILVRTGQAQRVAERDAREPAVAEGDEAPLADLGEFEIAPALLTISSTYERGIANVCPPAATVRLGRMLSVSGTRIRKRVPSPGSDSISSVPPNFSMFARTTSIPTPRPEIAVTASAVDSPGS